MSDTLNGIIERLNREADRLDLDGIECFKKCLRHSAYANTDMARALRIAAKWLETPDVDPVVILAQLDSGDNTPL